MTHRTLAAALATAVLSLAAAHASAGPLTSSILTKGARYPTVALTCNFGPFKEPTLILSNKSGIEIPQGSKIIVVFRFGNRRFVTRTYTAYRTVLGQENLTIEILTKAKGCTATATISKPYSSAR